MRMEFRFKINALFILLGLNAVIFLLALLTQSAFGFDDQLFYIFGGLITPLVAQGDFWLMITSAFFHLDFLHFIINMYSLFRLGQIVQFYYDDKTLFLTYIFGALGGSLLSHFASIYLGNSPFSLGASAGIIALIGLLFGGSFRKRRYGSELPFSIGDILPVVIFSFWIGLIPGSRINNWAHLGGFLAGTIIGMLINHSMNNFASRFEVTSKKVLYLLAVAIFIVSFIMLIANAVNMFFL
jgi:rhomboid protease GluP